MTATVFRQSYMTPRPSLFALISYCAIVVSFALIFTNGWFTAMVFNVGEIAPQGAILWHRRFGGRFLPVKTYYNFEFIPKKQYLLLWNQSIWCSFDSMDHDKGL